MSAIGRLERREVAGDQAQLSGDNDATSSRAQRSNPAAPWRSADEKEREMRTTAGLLRCARNDGWLHQQVTQISDERSAGLHLKIPELTQLAIKKYKNVKFRSASAIARRALVCDKIKLVMDSLAEGLSPRASRAVGGALGMHIEIIGSHPRSGGSECILFGHVGRGSDHFEPIGRGPQAPEAELSTHGGWEIKEMRPGAGLGVAQALVASSASGGYCRSTGRVVLVAHRWSGVLQVNDIGRRYRIDLYSDETRLVLLDVVNELIVDITSLASTIGETLALPDLTIDALVNHVVADAAWFRFLERDGDFNPGWTRRTIEVLRRPPPETLRRRLVHALLPVVNVRPQPVAAIPSPPPAFAFKDVNRLRDETRLLAAAVEGLALRTTKA